MIIIYVTHPIRIMGEIICIVVVQKGGICHRQNNKKSDGQPGIDNFFGLIKMIKSPEIEGSKYESMPGIKSGSIPEVDIYPF